MENSYQKFRWCIHNILNVMFKAIFINAFEGEIISKFGYFCILSIVIGATFGLFHGFCIRDELNIHSTLYFPDLVFIVQVASKNFLRFNILE